MDIAKTIKEAMKGGKLVIGTKRVMKGIKSGEISLVIYASNIKKDVKEELEFYRKHFNIELVDFGKNSKLLGEMCGKPFTIMALGIKK